VLYLREQTICAICLTEWATGGTKRFKPQTTYDSIRNKIRTELDALIFHSSDYPKGCCTRPLRSYF